MTQTPISLRDQILLIDHQILNLDQSQDSKQIQNLINQKESLERTSCYYESQIRGTQEYIEEQRQDLRLIKKQMEEALKVKSNTAAAAAKRADAKDVMDNMTPLINQWIKCSESTIFFHNLILSGIPYEEAINLSREERESDNVPELTLF